MCVLHHKLLDNCHFQYTTHSYTNRPMNEWIDTTQKHRDYREREIGNIAYTVPY